MNELVGEVLGASRKNLFGRRPIFERSESVSEEQLNSIETKLGCKLPSDLRSWLLAVGFGDLDQALSIRPLWLTLLTEGALVGFTVFAQDELGSHYAFDPSGEIYFIPRSEPGFAKIAQNFHSFLQELIRRDYKIVEWADELPLQEG